MVKKKDIKKIRKILMILTKNPEGLWIRQLARETDLALSTVHYYINCVLDEFIENIGVKDKNGKYFGLRFVKLKPKIRETIEKDGLKKVYKFLEMSKKM
ncbi:MAG: hypothetical protein DRP10_02105 [Candidatus Aenigmatarchaeota archaeon]|nr:MAG: hypothetical protein DRP10_02105 [Candidatus Aenigmarchaeota archaeon]